MESFQIIGTARTTFHKLADCPLQESEGAPEGMLVIEKKYLPAVSGLNAGSKIIVLTWLHKGDRSTLTTKPRNNPAAKTLGVFATRSPDRPNPIGLHVANVISVSETGEIRVSNLEVLDGTPIIDIKPSLD